MKRSRGLVEFAKPRGASQCGAHGVGGVIRIVERRAEHRHDGVADIFVDEAAMGLDDIRHGRKILRSSPRQVRYGAIFSENEEKSAISEKYTVTLRISPTSAGGLFDAIIFSITAGAR